MTIGITDKLVAKNGAFEDLVNASEVGGDGTSSNALPADTVASGSASELVRVDSTGAYLEGAGVAVTDLATAAQGALADSALQSSDIGSSVQAYDAELAAIAGLASAADRVPYFTGSGTASLATFTSAGRALVDDASASAQRTTLGLVAGGAGDIWVEKAGDTMTGDLNLSGGSVAIDSTEEFRVNRGGATIDGYRRDIFGTNIFRLASVARLQMWGAGDVGIGSGAAAPAGTRGSVLVFGDNGGNPTMGASSAAIYATTGGSGTGSGGALVEMVAQDSANNRTTISPHNFSMFEPDLADPLPWAYHSSNAVVGKEISVDMAKLARLVEQLTGEKLVYIRDLPESERKTWDEIQDEHEAARQADQAAWDAAPEAAKQRDPRPADYQRKPEPAWIAARKWNRDRGNGGAR